MPSSLFLKIFLWFSAVVLTGIVGTFIVAHLTRPEPFRPPLRGPIDQSIKHHAESAAEIYERDGQSGLAKYLESVHGESGMHIWLFNGEGRNLSIHKAPEGAATLAQETLETSQSELVSQESTPLLGRLVVSPRGERYALIAEMPMRRRAGPFPFPGPILHLVAMGMVGALFCYWLARYLTSPITKLRSATRELAQGKLDTRVAPSLGRRRDELASLAADFDVMAEQIESLISSQRRLLGDISHELRSPLARLNVALELAQQRAGEGATEALERIQREAENLNELIGQLLALTRLESGAEVHRETKLDLRQLVTEVVDDADFEARGRNRSVKLESAIPIGITGTEQLLRRAIENVVRNAAQYTAPNTEVEVRLEGRSGEACGSVNKDGEFSGDQSNSCAVITVRDHGKGVPETALAEIFRPFYRVDEARDREAGGAGLGLAIAQRAVRLHGGEVTARNVPPGGLLVTITIPTRKAPL